MRDIKKYTIAQASHWLNRCYDLGFTAEEVVARSVSKHNVSKRKEKGKGKEKFPPHPLIEKREREEKVAVKNTFAGANGGVAKVGKYVVPDVDLVPTLDTFLAWCEKAGFIDLELCKSKFNDTILCGWKDGRGKIIRNWPKFFLKLLRGNCFNGEYARLSGDIRMMFDTFWKEYPRRRRVEKDKCAKKFRSILTLENEDSVHAFNQIMNGLATWKGSNDWRKEEGQYVMMPYRWLLNKYWMVTPEQVRMARRGRGVSQTANVHSAEVGRW